MLTRLTDPMFQRAKRTVKIFLGEWKSKGNFGEGEPVISQNGISIYFDEY